jgi:hypothetical protein
MLIVSYWGTFLISFILVRHTNIIKEITQFRPVWLLRHIGRNCVISSKEVHFPEQLQTQRYEILYAGIYGFSVYTDVFLR